MLHYIKGDLLEVKNGILAHGVNCQGAFGSGVALNIKNKYPSVYRAYRRAVEQSHDRGSLLGMVQLVNTKPDGVYDPNEDTVLVANIFTQLNYGKDGKRYLDYEALYVGFEKLYNRSFMYDLPLCIPKIGCGLAGGDWGIVSKMIEKAYPKDVFVYVYE
jgi:O-acetyl-ADP-ribose deacetylase (regulator of RNase III)